LFGLILKPYLKCKYFYHNVLSHGDRLRFEYRINVQMEPIQFHLDNRLGMKEVVENLYLGDVVVKDRDRFVVLFSGFV